MSVRDVAAKQLVYYFPNIVIHYTEILIKINQVLLQSLF